MSMRLSNTIRPTEPSGVFALPCARGLWRRVSVHRRLCFETAADGSTNRLDRFTYDNYLCVARNRWQPDGTSATDRFTWDPTEPVATRPLALYQPNASPQLYAVDGNKNVSELVSFDSGIVSAHYEYAPFGEVILSFGDLALTNPFRFSSEYADDALALVYYNYRHYEPLMGRWLNRDLLGEDSILSLYCYVENSFDFDSLGLDNPSSFLAGMTDADAVKNKLRDLFPNDPKRCMKEFQRWAKANGLKRSSLRRTVKSTKSILWKTIAKRSGKFAVKCMCHIAFTIEIVLIPMSAGAEPEIIDGKPVPYSSTSSEITKEKEVEVQSKSECDSQSYGGNVDEGDFFSDDEIEKMTTEDAKMFWESL